MSKYVLIFEDEPGSDGSVCVVYDILKYNRVTPVRGWLDPYELFLPDVDWDYLDAAVGQNDYTILQERTW